MDNKYKVLFVCVHNSARSQIAEAYLNKFGSDKFIAQSAGLEPGRLNPLVIDVLKEEGIDISGKETKSVYDLFKKGMSFHYVITVCDKASSQKCPVFPGVTKRLNWSFADPSFFEGTYSEKLAMTRQVRDLIKAKIHDFMLHYNKIKISY
ncbi:MAG: arsenate reductase ArsC [Spirochaetes bacterium]|nr:arsenate reductase ArsC [Spirochaetota bacterium]